jgi:hypothetical protein
MPDPTLPSPTLPHWNGTFAQTDDWTNQAFYNMFLEAVWERMLVTGAYSNQPSYPAGGGPSPTSSPPVNPPRPPKVQLYQAATAGPPPAAAVPGTDCQWTLSNFTPGILYFGNAGNAQAALSYLTVAEMQSAIMAMVNSPVWTDPTFNLVGAGPRGAADGFYLSTVNAPPVDLVMTLQKLSSLVGTAAPPTAGGGVFYCPFTRKRRRQIFSATGNTASNQWYAGTGGAWDLTMSPAATVGMKAILLEFGQFGFVVPGTGVVGAGFYRGVYIYQGGGTWTPSTDPFDQADLLSSTSSPTSGNYCTPHVMEHGDVFGPWIWTNLRNALNCLTRSMPGWSANSSINIDPSFPQTINRVPTAYAAPGQLDTVNALILTDTGTSAAGAMSAVDALWPGTPAQVGAGNPITPGFLFGAFYFSGGPSPFTATIDYVACQFGFPGTYLGRAAAMDTYLLATGTGWNTFYDNGFGMTDGTWALFDTTNLGGTGGDIFGEALGTRVFGGIKPAWPAVSGGARSRGMKIEGVISLLRWDVAGGFKYTSSTP